MRKATIVAIVLFIGGLGFAAATPQRGRGGGVAAASGTAGVRISGFEFRPRRLTVKAGTTVTWTNETGSHTVTADDGSFESPTLGAGETYARKFAKPGTYPYHCAFHGGGGGEGMSGTVVVVR